MNKDEKLEMLLAEHLRSPSHREAETTTRLLAALPRPLPRQRHAWRLWPMELLDMNFAPAWPRVAALASCAVLGFAVGVASPILHKRSPGFAPPAQGEAGFTAVLSAPEPLTGALP